MYDLIGDIHGHAAELEHLLRQMGYRHEGGAFRHPERRVVFVGDFIDRGPMIAETLLIVRSMVEAGSALAVMGNHEFNVLAYHTPDPDLPGEFLRRHSDKNVAQHAATLDQIAPGELASHLDWFRDLPLWLELEGLRVVHACWHPDLVERTRSLGMPTLTDDMLLSACRPGGTLHEPVEVLLKGPELPLPAGHVIRDRQGVERRAVRARWFANPAGHTYRSYAFTPDDVECDMPVPATAATGLSPYPSHDAPVFIGHYWLSGTKPMLLAPNIACLDWSVARGGFLCAYRWSGESTLDDAHFMWIGRTKQPRTARHSCQGRADPSGRAGRTP